VCLVRKTLRYPPSIVRYCPYDMGLCMSCVTVSVQPWLRDLNWMFCVGRPIRPCLSGLGNPWMLWRSLLCLLLVQCSFETQQLLSPDFCMSDSLVGSCQVLRLTFSIQPCCDIDHARTRLNTPLCTLRYVTHPSCFVRGSSACSAEVSISLSRGREPTCVVGL